MNGLAHRSELRVSFDWRQYTVLDFGEQLSLADPEGRLPRMIVMLEDGDLLCLNSRGVDRSLRGLKEGYEHKGQVSAVLPEQEASFIAYW